MEAGLLPWNQIQKSKQYYLQYILYFIRIFLHLLVKIYAHVPDTFQNRNFPKFSKAYNKLKSQQLYSEF